MKKNKHMKWKYCRRRRKINTRGENIAEEEKNTRDEILPKWQRKTNTHEVRNKHTWHVKICRRRRRRRRINKHSTSSNVFYACAENGIKRIRFSKFTERWLFLWFRWRTQMVGERSSKFHNRWTKYYILSLARVNANNDKKRLSCGNCIFSCIWCVI